MLRTIKGLMGYMGCVCITLAVAYYIDGTAGIILTLALICAFVFSLVLTLAVKSSISVDISLDKTMLVKGDELNCMVKLSKRLPLPAPVIEIEADCTPHLALKSGRIFKGAIAGTEVNKITVPYSARYSGEAEVRIISVRLTDFLGIFSMKLKLPTEQTVVKTAVYPNIPDAAVQTDFLKTASRFSDNDEEEETDETAIGSTGMPGYEHRQYYPGDPIKKINWKLSSKRDIYMVRLDEKTTSAGQVFFLDCPVMDVTEESLAVRDNVIEGALAMFSMLVREGREAAFYRWADDLWLKTDIKNMGDIYQLQELMSDYSPSEPQQIVPPEIASSGKTPICFTASMQGSDRSAVEISTLYPDALLIASEKAALNKIGTNFWTVSDDFEIRKKID